MCAFVGTGNVCALCSSPHELSQPKSEPLVRRAKVLGPKGRERGWGSWVGVGICAFWGLKNHQRCPHATSFISQLQWFCIRVGHDSVWLGLAQIGAESRHGTGSTGHLGHLSRPGHRVIILTRCETPVFLIFEKMPKMQNVHLKWWNVSCLLLDWNLWMSVHAMNVYLYLWLFKNSLAWEYFFTHKSTFGVHSRTGSPGQLGLRVAGFPGQWVAGSQNVHLCSPSIFPSGTAVLANDKVTQWHWPQQPFFILYSLFLLFVYTTEYWQQAFEQWRFHTRASTALCNGCLLLLPDRTI